jgi:hypothetical protein
VVPFSFFQNIVSKERADDKAAGFLQTFLETGKSARHAGDFFPSRQLAEFSKSRLNCA